MFDTIVRPKTFGKNEIEDLQDWTWPAMDDGSWGNAEDGTGPLGDWLQSHKFKWFETVRKYEVCVQAGGNMGMYPRILSDIFKIVYTFEPHPLSFHCLVQNCQESNIVKINGALGPCAGMINNLFTTSGADNMGMNTIHTEGEPYIPMFALDDIRLKACDLIALDVEGFESGVLAGAMMTIDQFKPVIIGERTDNDDIKSVLEPFGYEITDTSHGDTIWTFINR
jgi:FkbM family methyltransferase